MTRLFHIAGFSVPKKAKLHTVSTPVALYLLGEDSTVTLLGIVNSVHVVNNRQGFALTKRDIRRLGNGTFDMAYTIAAAHKNHHLVAYHVPGAKESLAQIILERLKKTASLDYSGHYWHVPAGYDRHSGLNMPEVSC